MPKEVFEQKIPRPAPVAPHANGKAATSRVPALKTEKRKSSAWLWIMLGVVLLVALAAGVYFFLPQDLPGFLQKGRQQDQTATTTATGKHGAASDKIRIVPATATRGDIGIYLKGLGSVTPLNTDTIQSRVNGQLMKVDFTEGQMVKAGDPLLEIDDRPYQAQLEQYLAQKEHDQALLDNANIDLQRYETLLKQDSISGQTVATQQALVKQDQGTVDSDQALIDATRLNISYCNITAPISGRVGLRLVDVGNYVQSTSSTGLLVIAQVQPITVVFTIPEDSVPAVMAKINAGEQLTVEAWDRKDEHKITTGTLLTTDNLIDPATGTLRMKAVFANEDNALFPNQFVNAHLLVETRKNVVTVPVAAIQYGTQGTFVYVVNDDDPKNATVTMKNVVVGATTLDGSTAEIQSGVNEGDVVVIDGVDKLQNGSKVIVPTDDNSQSHNLTGAPADAGTGAGS
jgi:multidrug efflux system membrane fusion protein